MIHEPARATHVILITFIFALALTILPMPTAFADYRPEWVAIVLLYWIMALPHRVGIFSAWMLGIALDVLKGALLGQHALALAIAAFLMLHLHLRLRMYPFWQQSVVIGLILLIYQALLFWIYDMTSDITLSWPYWIPSLIGAVLWPWLFIILRDVRRRYNVN